MEGVLLGSSGPLGEVTPRKGFEVVFLKALSFSFSAFAASLVESLSDEDGMAGMEDLGRPRAEGGWAVERLRGETGGDLFFLSEPKLLREDDFFRALLEVDLLMPEPEPDPSSVMVLPEELFFNEDPEDDFLSERVSNRGESGPDSLSTAETISPPSSSESSG